MKIPTIPATCSICGGPGSMSITHLGKRFHPWIHSEQVTHTDPRVCQEYLRQEREKLDLEKKGITT